MQLITEAQPSTQAFAGMLSDTQENFVVSRLAEGNLFLGCLAVFGTNQPSVLGSPGQAKPIVDAAADVNNYIGVPVWESGKEPPTISNAKSAIASGYLASIVRRGAVWVYVETAVDPTSAVYARVLTVSNDVKGQFRAGAAANFVALPAGKATFLTSTSGPGIAILALQ